MAELEESKLKLMVVDDEADNLELLHRTFRRDFEVFLADSGVKALQTLEQQGEMAIIISDQRMPKMNGTEFLSRTVDRFPDTMRILLTGYTDVEDLVGAINAGKVFKYITKPWNPDDLMVVVQQAAETYRLLKQRTQELHRALRRESLFNTITTAIRESLDYRNMLQTVVETVGEAFEADSCLLRPVQNSSRNPQYDFFASEVFSYMAPSEQNDTYPSVPYLALPKLEAVIEQRQIERIQSQIHEIYETNLVVPLAYQQEPLAVLTLSKQSLQEPWTVEEVELLEGVAEQAALAISQAKLYQRIQEQTEQMRAELAVAHQIQTNLLRQSWPQLDSVRVQAHCYPAREVGGDFFEVYVHPQGDIWIAVGDVSGKGVPAALFMASAISLLRRELAQEVPPEPNIVMQNMNSSLSEDLVGSNCFITMVLARYSPSTHELVYANAGHIYPLVWSPQFIQAQVITPQNPSAEPSYLKVRGVPLGILPNWKAPSGKMTLKAGEVLLLTSDGITEATIAESPDEMTSSTAMLQQAGLWKLLSKEKGELDLNHLLNHIQTHSQIQEDDQTILSLEVL
ncbi:MAG: SpoIIE family protein phosphatase [Oculatellaceae cyanobacterium Prado106]|nr:SpoIIE family protein phosphatase [Oculatellaceae cyanobacterium Prado106]